MHHSKKKGVLGSCNRHASGRAASQAAGRAYRIVLQRSRPRRGEKEGSKGLPGQNFSKGLYSVFTRHGVHRANFTLDAKVHSDDMLQESGLIPSAEKKLLTGPFPVSTPWWKAQSLRSAVLIGAPLLMAETVVALILPIAMGYTSIDSLLFNACGYFGPGIPKC